MRRPSDVNDEVLRSMISAYLTLTSPEDGFNLGIHQTTALDHIERSAKKKVPVFKIGALGVTLSDIRFPIRALLLELTGLQ
ncbi:hypothetical protein TNCV_1861981 [Trichonephila clavipes]|nr:hypothetical protein TNCV_1861981 [Trichonephila clavipes]